MSERLLILGASARAAAASARRAGFEPFAIDLFADADTKRICDCLKCPPGDYPHGLFRLARQVPPMPWMYTGGLENYPELVGELAAERDLWGNGPGLLREVRDPFRLTSHFARRCHGIKYPTVLPAGSPLAGRKRWLRKPLKGSGGFGVRFASDRDPHDAEPDHYYQEFVAGRPFSALSIGYELGFQWLGVTSQLIGTKWLHAPPFRYAGNVGVIEERMQLKAALFSALHTIDLLGVHGVFGIDFIDDGDHSYVVEVNPRYTASIEVVEYATRQTTLKPSTRTQVDPPKIVGKAVYYAPRRLTVPESGPWDESLAHADDVWRRPDYADIPHAGDAIDRGHPVLTMLAEAATEEDCLSQLQSRAADLDHLFGASP